MKIEYDEAKNIITISTPWGNQLAVSGDKNSIILSDQNKNNIIMDSAGITLQSAKDIIMKAKGGITLDASSKVNIKTKSEVKIEGLNVDVEAKVGFRAKGNAIAEISASAQTVIKGGIVMIN